MATRRAYRIVAGSETERFHASRAPIRILAGGFANGKTTALVIWALNVMRDYPGCNGMLGRATYPKLNSTVRREFFKWCPKAWIKSFNKNDNECVFTNGSILQFRYVQQQGKTVNAGEGTSNLLSANYDFIGIDQLEDPEITHKDMLDLLGRLRGTAEYIGDDQTMPRTGPRMFVGACNPTRNWVYRKLVKPLHALKRGAVDPDLICVREGGDGLASGKIILFEGKPKPLIDVFESSTYDNAQNIPKDYLQLLEGTYSGQMRERFLLGKWVAYEGLVYPAYDATIHMVPYTQMLEYYNGLRISGIIPNIREGYDDGIAVPSCYIFSFEDDAGNIFLMDGIYQADAKIPNLAAAMHEIRIKYMARPQPGQVLTIRADPAVFKRGRGDRRLVGETVAKMFEDEGIPMIPGNNDRLNGIIKIRSYLEPLDHHRHPITGNYGAPRLYVSDKLQWWMDEITDYFWKRDEVGNAQDEPRDGNDHGLDTTRYIFTDARVIPALANLNRKEKPKWLRWQERDVPGEQENSRMRMIA